MSEEKNEPATAKKVKDARKRGQIARSRDLAVAAASVAGTIALARFGGRFMEGLADRLARDLSNFGDNATRTVTGGEMAGLVIDGGAALALLVGPIAMATMVAGVAVHGMQGGWNFAPEGLKWDFTRLSPAQGFKKLGFSQSGIDTMKTLVSVAMIAWVGWQTTQLMMNDAARMAWVTPVDAARIGWDFAEGLLWQVAWGLGFLALADYGLQYYRLMQQLKMSKQEVRDEAKQSDGSAEMKGRIRRVQQDMARNRMMQDVPKATVVITNPTHYAIALEYRRGEMAAPRVLAKGKDQVAKRIREKAQAHGVPLFENKLLAQALYKTADIGETIPGPLFSAVAEVLAQLIRLKRLVL